MTPRTQYGRVFGLQWHVTNRCDQRCKTCYIWGEGRKLSSSAELTPQQCYSLVDDYTAFCESFQVDPVIAVTGGDPLLRDDIWDILTYIHSKGIRYIILGNPFYLNQDICARLKNMHCSAYQMSLDGLRNTHDRIRKPGSFQATLKAIKNLQGAGIRTMIMSTVSKMNYREIPELARLMVELEVNVYDFARYCPTGPDPAIMSPLGYRAFLSEMWKLYKQCIEKGVKTHFPLKDHLWRLFLYEEGIFRIRKSDYVVQGCGCGVRHMTVLPDGVVYACRRFESPVGKIPDQSLQEIFLGNAMTAYRDVEKLQDCSSCELLNFCRGCHAVSFGVGGSFFAKDPQCWRGLSNQPADTQPD